MNQTYQNPVCAGADPFVLLADGLYYHYSTNDPDGYRVLVSPDLVHWEDKGYCLHKDSVQGEKWFWAPEVLALDGKYYMVYTADTHLGIAVADTPPVLLYRPKKAGSVPGMPLTGISWWTAPVRYIFSMSGLTMAT